MSDHLKPKGMLEEPTGGDSDHHPEGVRVDPKVRRRGEYDLDFLKKIVKNLHDGEPEKFADLKRFINQLPKQPWGNSRKALKGLLASD